MNSDDSMLGSFSTHFDHGLLIIDDSESVASHEDWDSTTEYVHVDHDSLFVAVQSMADGPVAVEVYRHSGRHDVDQNLIAAFNGEIDTSSGYLKVHDSDDKMTFSHVGRPSRRRLDVFVDELNFATRVVVLVGDCHT